MWQNGQHNTDYQFQDQRASEMYTIGGTGINVHLYLGTFDQGATEDATEPSYATVSEQNIQDLLFLENRDRKYDQSVYDIRGVYNVSDIDFDLSQFGLTLAGDTLFITFHINDMVAQLGRKLMNGDVLELQHLKDYYSLGHEGIPAALKRYYKIEDASNASEGFGPSWWPHLWRVKCTPIVDSQEYRDIFTNTTFSEGGSTLKDLLSSYQDEIAINDAILQQAEAETPESGYDIDQFYVVPVDDDSGEMLGPEESANANFTNTLLYGDGEAPNGFSVLPSITFPTSPSIGDYVLRLDYLPNRLFRWDGAKWVKIEDAVNTDYSPGTSLNIRGSFINNSGTFTAQDGVTTVNVNQNLSDLLSAKADIVATPDLEGAFAAAFAAEFD